MDKERIKKVLAGVGIAGLITSVGLLGMQCGGKKAETPKQEKVGQASDQVAFSCQHDHDETVGLLLVRAPNVRVALKEQELAASRGVLSAPGKQE